MRGSSTQSPTAEAAVMSDSVSSPTDRTAAALHLLLSSETKAVDVFNFLLKMDTDDLIRTLTNAGVITKSPVQVRHELLREARDQLRDRPFFSHFRPLESGESLKLSSYISELQSISKRFTAAKNSNVALNIKINQVAALQMSLVRIQSMPLKREGDKSAFDDVRRYAAAIMQHMCEWQLRCQEVSLDGKSSTGASATTGMARGHSALSKASERSI